MQGIDNIYILLNLAGGVGMALMFTISLFKRHGHGSLFFILLCGGSSIWAIIEAVKLFAITGAIKILMIKIQYLGIAIVPPSMFMVSMVYAGDSFRWRLNSSIPFYIPSALMIIAIWTNDYHELVWTGFTHEKVFGYLTMGIDFGYYFWVWVGYSYILIFLSIFYLASYYLKAEGIVKRHVLLLVIGMPFPLVLNLIYLSGLSPVKNIDMTPLSFCFISLIFATNFFRYNFLGIMPFAKDVVFETLRDPVIVINFEERIVDRNRAAKELFSKNGEDVTGEKIGDVFTRIFNNPERIFKESNRDNELVTMDEFSPKTYLVNISHIQGRSGGHGGSVFVLRDISRRKLLEKELRRIADTDFLTGVLNRRSFMTTGSRELNRVKRYGGNLSVISFDLDHFKKINDSFGHDAGDVVLKGFAMVVRLLCRSSDIFGRLGGEEFSVLLPETDAYSAMKLAKRLKDDFQEKTFVFGKNRVKCTVSIGCAQFRKSDQKIDDLMKRADIALYKAKEGGRNKIVMEI